MRIHCRACAMAHRSQLDCARHTPPAPRPLRPLPTPPHPPTPPNSRPEGEWACPAHKPGRKRSKELGQLERDQEMRAQAAAGGFRPKPPRTDARYQAPPAVYISGPFLEPGTAAPLATRHLTRTQLGAADETPHYPLAPAQSTHPHLPLHPLVTSPTPPSPLSEACPRRNHKICGRPPSPPAPRSPPP